MIALKNIVVATDFEEAAGAALAYGRELARTFGARLILLNVADDLLAKTAALGGYMMNLETAQAEINADALKKVEERLTDDDRQSLRAKSVVLVSPSPAGAILDYAQHNKVDLLIVGTHGRGAMGHLFMGSVAERVVRGAPCPVLTVRSTEHDFVLPDALVAMSYSRSGA